MNFNVRKIFIITVLTICAIAIGLVVIFQITEKSDDNKENEVIVDTVALTENFENIFDNQINYQGNEVNIDKKEYSKELIYTSYTSEEIGDSYELNVNIPYLNINSETVNQINEEITNLFYEKVSNILLETSIYTEYNVKYKAYVNDNILSLIISADLKEGDNSERRIIKTYNYNLSSDSILNIEEILQYRNISNEYAQNRIIETIQEAIKNAENDKVLGYNKYLRNVDDNMYKIENTGIYFLGENKAVYIVYPYGNSNYTTQTDLLVM